MRPEKLTLNSLPEGRDADDTQVFLSDGETYSGIEGVRVWEGNKVFDLAQIWRGLPQALKMAALEAEVTDEEVIQQAE